MSFYLDNVHQQKKMHAEKNDHKNNAMKNIFMISKCYFYLPGSERVDSAPKQSMS